MSYSGGSGPEHAFSRDCNARKRYLSSDSVHNWLFHRCSTHFSSCSLHFFHKGWERLPIIEQEPSRFSWFVFCWVVLNVDSYPDLSLIIWYPAHVCILFDVCLQHCVMLAQLMILYCAVSLTRSKQYCNMISSVLRLLGLKTTIVF